MYTPEHPVEGRGARHAVIFDGARGMCRRWIRRLEGWDRDDVVETVPFQEPSVTARFPWIPPGAYEEAVQVVAPHGRTWSGAGAVERLASVLPSGLLLSGLFRLPLVRPVADREYARGAAGRSGWGRCGVHCG